ncbi:MAG: universal stress protein [Pseudomonadales bacterium]|nr:universal stress protein [Pseudomonadales bacterium]MCP5182648.1 universal stress protein [Pseudomonadales bacterium]
MQLNSILTLVDKPKHPQTAIARTRQLIRESGAAAHLVAYCWHAVPDGDGLFTRKDARVLKDRLVAEHRAWLMEEVSAFKELEGARVSVLWTDDIADSLQRIAAQTSVDLIVKSIHQSGTLLHTPLDWELLRTSPAPVLLTTTRARRKRSNVVLAAVDTRRMDRAHTRLNRRVLDSAHAFASLQGGTVHVVSALDIPTVLVDLDVVDKRKVTREARLLAQQRLTELLAPYDIPASRRHFPAGKVGQAVNHVARSMNADLLVVGSMAHRLKRLVGIGTSAEKIVSRAVCDVLAVHP